MKNSLYATAAFLLLFTTACDRNATVEEAKDANGDLVETTSTTAPRDQMETSAEQQLELRRVEHSVSPLKDLSQAERNVKLIEATDDEVATEAIAFMESRIKLNEQQKSAIIAYSQELNLSDKNANDRRTALKMMRKKIKQDILTADQLRQFKSNRR